MKNLDRVRASYPGIRGKLYEIIYEAETPAGKAFDVGLLFVICVSLVAVCLESVESIRESYGSHLRVLEWTVTLAFTVEYLLRIIVIRNPRNYMFSFFGFVDLLSILPTYLSLYLAGTHSLIVIRAIRLLRVFRVLKLHQFIGESHVLVSALAASRNKILVFISSVLVLDLIFGAMMYLIEGPESGFTSIPRGMYWAIVTMTTVGYGDITPESTLGQIVSSFIMIIGYGIIAVPTGIVSTEMAIAHRAQRPERICPECGTHGHDADSSFCRFCAAPL